ncbi:diguanylate cyclase [Haliea sp. E1-2-M8]|uniref:putative bifunctional diguanylate cyclase/phosphodiesterase n=1 Tax=Haliea sp. E1-2-M8 TaxID=3064706 RepID=UPI00272085BC|nr:GGDEF and EAL domain-containing protein [Haliea sp. E1-2-M8]MDO8863555.1 diguanylate cyclase [Haliea sp. E1-2-M8]
MKLAQFIRTNMELLLQDWEDAVLEIAPEMKGDDSRVLRDHARAMLEFISQYIEPPQTTGESASKTLAKNAALLSGIGKAHATHRHQQGMSMVQVVQELRALRARVTENWGDEQKGLTERDIGELVRFSEAIDQLIATAVSNFSARKEQETRLIETMLKASLDPAAIFDPAGRLMFLNTAMAALVEAPAQEAIGKTPRELGLDFATEFQEDIVKTVTSGRPQRKELHHRLSSGRDVYFDCQLVPVFNDRSEVEAIVKTSRDITERKQVDHHIWRSANFDSLTGIPNRRLFLDRLEQTLLEAQRKDSSFALLFIDLDRFKQANDMLGHEAGDRLLVQVAQRISTKVRAMDTVARLGGDEFTLILKETGRKGATDAAKALLTRLEHPFEVDSHRLHISGSIGLTVFPEDGKNADQLMHNADQAMYAAKKHGGQQVKIYELWMAQSESEHMRLNRELDDALRENQLEVYYQPIIDTRTGAISRAEALLRWNHPSRGLLTPTAFLSNTELNRMTDRISAYVLAEAVTCSFRWRDLSGSAFPININESPASFDTRSLMDQWQAQLEKIAVDESSITMELTSASLNNIQASGSNLVERLGLAGSRLSFSIDKFGIEPFSPLALQESRIGSVKIDRELIKGAGEGGASDRIVEGIIAMAHAINIEVVGVGVEKEDQLQFLSCTDCDYAQGYLFSRPLRQGDFEAMLQRDRHKKAS